MKSHITLLLALLLSSSAFANTKSKTKSIAFCNSPQTGKLDFSDNSLVKPLVIPKKISQWIKEVKSDYMRVAKVEVSQVRYFQHPTFKEGFITVIVVPTAGSVIQVDCSWANRAEVERKAK